MTLKDFLENTAGDVAIAFLSDKFEPIIYDNAAAVSDRLIPNEEEIEVAIYTVTDNIIVLTEV